MLETYVKLVQTNEASPVADAALEQAFNDSVVLQEQLDQLNTQTKTA